MVPYFGDVVWLLSQILDKLGDPLVIKLSRTVQHNLVPELHNMPLHLPLVLAQRQQNNTDSHVFQLLALKCPDSLIHFRIQPLSFAKVTYEFVCHHIQILVLLPGVAIFLLH